MIEWAGELIFCSERKEENDEKILNRSERLNQFYVFISQKKISLCINI